MTGGSDHLQRLVSVSRFLGGCCMKSMTLGKTCCVTEVEVVSATWSRWPGRAGAEVVVERLRPLLLAGAEVQRLESFRLTDPVREGLTAVTITTTFLRSSK